MSMAMASMTYSSGHTQKTRGVETLARPTSYTEEAFSRPRRHTASAPSSSPPEIRCPKSMAGPTAGHGPVDTICGKTMLASRLPGILPDMTHDECLDVSRIPFAAGPSRRGCSSSRPDPSLSPSTSPTRGSWGTTASPTPERGVARSTPCGSSPPCSPSPRSHGHARS
ncbi:MAG: ATP-binding protein [Deltaproteobacteria bacterium]|nr:ATP-binding protein [Deltaproteobacteria bacterium]